MKMMRLLCLPILVAVLVCLGQNVMAKDKPIEVVNHRRNLSLLQHDFADPDEVGIATVAPGQVAGMNSIPFQEFLVKWVGHKQKD